MKNTKDKCAQIAIMLGYDKHLQSLGLKGFPSGLSKKDNTFMSWDPSKNWEQLMPALDFIENLPKEPKNKSKEISECVIHSIEFNRLSAAIIAHIYTKETGWKAKNFYSDYGDYISIRSKNIDASKFKRQMWFDTIAEFATWYNKCNITFVKK